MVAAGAVFPRRSIVQLAGDAPGGLEWAGAVIIAAGVGVLFFARG